MDNDKKLILVVDDNAENRKVLGSLMMKSGYDVSVSHDGYEALDFIKTCRPDLILLDIIMPGINGYEVCKKLKADLRVRNIPIIFLTAKATPEDIVKGFEAGGVDYVTKPFNKAELLARVKTHLELKVLKMLLPICASCKKVRDEEGDWSSIEQYLKDNFDVIYSHGMCQKCADKIWGDQEWYIKKKEKMEGS